MTPSPVEQGADQQQQDSLISTLKEKLKDLLKNHVEADTDPEKTAQFRVARRNLLYFEGKQNLVPVWISPGIADFSSTGNPISPGKQSDDTGQFDYPFNFVRGDGLKAISVTGKAPVCNAVPDDPEDDEAIVRSQDANAVSSHFDQDWNSDELQKDIMFTLWTLGPTFIYTHYVSDGQKYGYHDEPEMEAQDIVIGDGGYQCDNCGLFNPSEDFGTVPCPRCDSDATIYQPPVTAPVAVKVGTKRYQKGSVECDVCDITTVTTQFDAKNLDKVQYLRYEYEAPKGGLIALFPKLREKLESNTDPSGGSGAASQVGMDTRGVANSPTGIRYYRKDRWRYTQDWLLPSMYEYVDEKPYREALASNFPEGMKISSVDGEPQKLEPQKLTDYWAACRPSVGKRLHGDALCTDAIPLSDLYTDGQNMAAETEYHGIPATVVDNQIFDREAMENRAPNPAEMIFVNLQGQDPNKLIKALPTATFSEHLMPWLQGVREDARDLTGTGKAIAGLEGKTQTAEEARLRQNAALKQLSIAYDNTRHLWVKVRTNACKEAARYGIGEIKAPVSQGMVGYQSRKVDLAKFSMTGIHFEVDEGMPASFAEERDRINKMIVEAPQVATLIQLDNGYNAPALNKYIGVRGLLDPRANERIYVKRTIDKLLKEKPQQSIGPDGQPKMDPSIPIRVFEDNHQNCADIVKVWCSTTEGLEQSDTNNEGYQNVVNWGIAHQAAIPPPPMEPPPSGKGPSSTKKPDLGQGAEAGSPLPPQGPMPPQPAPPPESPMIQ